MYFGNLTPNDAALKWGWWILKPQPERLTAANSALPSVPKQPNQVGNGECGVLEEDAKGVQRSSNINGLESFDYV